MKSFNLLPIFLFFLATLITPACKKDKVAPVDPPPTPEELFYTNCGKIPPVVSCINGANFFVPNAISPNLDGTNDILFVFVGDGIKEIISFKIHDEDGGLVFEKSNILLDNNNTVNNGWNGKLPDGSTQDGIYNYTISLATLQDEIAEFEGAVCVRTSLPLNCVEHEKHIAWSTQYDGNGGFNFALPSYENCE